MNDSLSAACSVRQLRLPFNIRPVVKNMHSILTLDALLVIYIPILVGQSSAYRRRSTNVVVFVESRLQPVQCLQYFNSSRRRHDKYD